MDRYAPETVFSSIDHGGRYAYGRQPQIGMWNMARFAETLLPLLDPDEEQAIAAATEAVQSFVRSYQVHWLEGMRAKLGLQTAEESDGVLAEDFLQVLHDGQVDFTMAFRSLVPASHGATEDLRSLFGCAQGIDAWLERWRARLEREGGGAEEVLRRANPVYVPRNHKVEEALEAAVERSDLGPFEELREVLRQPFDEQPGREAYAVPAPADGEPYQTFCGT